MEKRERSIAPFVVVLAVVMLALRLRDGTANMVDDALITLRHARNVALGAGVVYNAGEPVLGTTTPLYALVHGGVGALIGADRIPWSSVIGNALCDVLAAILIIRWMSEVSGNRAVGLAAAALYGLAPRAIEYSSGGMEEPLFTLIVLVGLREASREREITAGIASGLALVCRPDGGLLGAVAFAWLAWRARAFPWKFALAALVVASPWLSYATSTYPWGPIPQSVVAKAHRPWTLRPWHATRVLAFQFAAQGAGRTLGLVAGHDVLPSSLYYALLGALAIANAALMALGVRALRGAGVLLAAFGAAYALLYAIGNPTMFGWYQVPLEAIYATLIAAGVGALPLGGADPAMRRFAAGVALVLLQLFAATALRDHRSAFVLGERWDKTRERAYYAVAARLEGTVGPRDTIQISENGVFGWAWRGRVIDTVGLVTPGCEKYYPLPKEQLVSDMAVPPRLVLDFAPEVFISLEIFIRETCAKDQDFARAYAIDERASDRTCEVFGSRGMLVFRRRR